MSVIWSGITEEGAVVPVQVTAEGKVVAVGDGPSGDYLPTTGGNLTGDLTIDTDKIALTTDGSATFAGNVELGGTPSLGVKGSALLSAGVVTACVSPGSRVWYGYQEGSTTATSEIRGDGSATFRGSAAGGTTSVFLSPVGQIAITGASNESEVFKVKRVGSNIVNSIIQADGSATFANRKCGFTSAGELFFTSRNERYKLIVSNGICQAEPYTSQMELKEKAEQFIADKRETKPSDSDPSDPSDPVSEVTTDPSDPVSEVTTDNDNA